MKKLIQKIKDKSGEWIMSVISAVLGLVSLGMYIGAENINGVIISLSVVICSIVILYSKDNLE